MSSAPRTTCTECSLEWRSCDVRTFPLCSKHRVCKVCFDKRGARSKSVASKDQCPVCDESRRRLGAQVRTSIWAEQNTSHVMLECVSCKRQVQGAVLMACQHAYCLPCLRKQPRSAQSRTVYGDMARGCHKCEKKAQQEFREVARYTMATAEEDARMVREVRETREFREDVDMLRERLRPKKRTAPRPPKAPERTLTVPVAPSFLEKTSDGNLGIAKPVWRKGPREPKCEKVNSVKSATEAAAVEKTAEPLDKSKRRVSFDPEVQQRVITPRVDKRHSLPASTLSDGEGSARTAHASKGKTSAGAAPEYTWLYRHTPCSYDIAWPVAGPDSPRLTTFSRAYCVASP